MFCSNCGEKNPDTVDKCVFCQADLQKPTITVTKPAKKNYTNFIIGAIVVITLLTVGIIISASNRKANQISVSDNNCTAKHAVIHWYNIYQSTDDDWNMYTPYIENNYIYIKTEMQLNSSLSVALRGFGTASINDTFNKTVPIEYEYENSNVTMGEYQNITIRIPISDLDVQKPTTLYCRLATYIGGMQKDIQLEFDIAW